MGGLTVLTGDALVTSIYGTQNGNRRGRRIDGRDALVASVHTIAPPENFVFYGASRGTRKTLKPKGLLQHFCVFCDGRRPFCVFRGQSPPRGV